MAMIASEVADVIQRLEPSGKYWMAHFQHSGNPEVELLILDVNGRPCPFRAEHARICLGRLEMLVAEMIARLMAVGADPLFPPPASRKWRFEGLEFTLGPSEGVGVFTLEEEEGWEYLYVRFMVDLVDGVARAGRAETY
ncbi:MAG: hypothetical protein IT379_35670 [Deltaproteobacteria bacterium]|nr:hypothetical protein [Deltaproteobacteria bacterium]